ncbi:MAG: hypothetical protein REI12_14075, partial [Pedobacter sp.]|nr:hypothetical protein [Pedobacter sp.]
TPFLHRVTLALLMLAAAPVPAEENSLPVSDTLTTGSPLLLAYGGRVVPPMDGMHKRHDEAKTETETAEPRVWDRALPFFAQRVIDKGYDLPNPYDIGVSVYVGSQDFEIGNLAVGFNGSTPQDLDFVKFPHSRIDTETMQLQMGAWVFPFLNVYGIVGRVQGKGDIDITIDGEGLMNYIGIPGCSAPPAVRPAICSQTLKGTAHADYDGSNYGVGLTAAGAWNDLFFALPITYVISDLSISDTKAKAWNVSPRVGWNFHPAGTGMVTVFTGGTWLKNDSYISGEFVFDTSSSPIGGNTTLQYNISEHPKMRWNALLGGNWMISKSWNLAAEVGFAGTRNDVIVTGFYRF